MKPSVEDANVAVVRAFYAGLLGGDVEGALREGLAANVIWENPLPSEIPFAGTFRGLAGAARYLELIFGQLDLEAFEIDEVLAGGASVVVLGHETAKVKATGLRYTQQWVHVLKLVDGRVVKIREYNDCAAITQAFALRVVAVDENAGEGRAET